MVVGAYTTYDYLVCSQIQYKGDSNTIHPMDLINWRPQRSTTLTQLSLESDALKTCTSITNYIL